MAKRDTRDYRAGQYESKEDARKRRQRPMAAFAAVVAMVALVGGVWAYHQYRLRKAVEAANQPAVLETEAPTEISSDEMNKQLQQNGLSVDNEGQLNVSGGNLDLSSMEQALAAKLQEGGGDTDADTALDIQCETDSEGNAHYTVNGVPQDKRPYLLDQKRLSYNGVAYEKDANMKAYLLLGVDSHRSLQETYERMDEGRSDGMFLVCENTKTHSVKVIQIVRDTMCPIYQTNDDFEITAIVIDHITRAWDTGDRHEMSGNYTRRAVSWLFGGLPIDGYLAGSIPMINTLNNAIGGVDVTIRQDYLTKFDPSFVQGATVHLEGDLAEKFVRGRDIDEQYTAMTRMERHRQYAVAFEDKVVELQKQDSNTIPHLFDLMQDNIITDMQKADYLKIAMDIAMSADPLTEDDFCSYNGKNTTTDYDEYWPDYEDIDKLVLSLFYNKV